MAAKIQCRVCSLGPDRSPSSQSRLSNAFLGLSPVLIEQHHPLTATNPRHHSRFLSPASRSRPGLMTAPMIIIFMPRPRQPTPSRQQRRSLSSSAGRRTKDPSFPYQNGSPSHHPVELPPRIRRQALRLVGNPCLRAGDRIRLSDSTLSRIDLAQVILHPLILWSL
jgi:hypothetical protein